MSEGVFSVTECLKTIRDNLYQPASQEYIALNKAIEALELMRQLHIAGLSLDKVAALATAQSEGRLIELPCKVGDTVYHLYKCRDIPERIDGTTYEFVNGNITHGTATGYYCPYEQDCPHDSDDCDANKDKFAVFADCVDAMMIAEEESMLVLEYTSNVYFDEVGKTLFLTRGAAENALKEKE